MTLDNITAGTWNSCISNLVLQWRGHFNSLFYLSFLPCFLSGREFIAWRTLQDETSCKQFPHPCPGNCNFLSLMYRYWAQRTAGLFSPGNGNCILVWSHCKSKAPGCAFPSNKVWMEIYEMCIDSNSRVVTITRGENNCLDPLKYQLKMLSCCLDFREKLFWCSLNWKWGDN